MKEVGWDPRAKVYSTVSADKPWEQVGGSYGEVVSPTGMSREMFPSLMRRRTGSIKAGVDGKVVVLKDGRVE
jgi:hypothetical protein